MRRLMHGVIMHGEQYGIPPSKIAYDVLQPNQAAPASPSVFQDERAVRVGRGRLGTVRGGRTDAQAT
jgi:hypothetical protein